MDTVISDIAQGQNQIVLGLPLQVEAPVFRVGQLIRGVVASKQEVEIGEAGRRAGRGNRFGHRSIEMVVDQRATPDRLLGGGASGVVPKGAPVRHPCPCMWRNGDGEGLLCGDAEGPAYARPALAESSVKYSPRSA